MDKEKVIKAYECCKNSYDRRCDKCPYEKDCCHDGLPMFVIKKMVALLKEQGEEIENLKQTAQSMMEGICLLKEQEAKQGKWERQYSRPGVYANLFWWCSVCGEPTRYNDAGIFYQYCPHCGAKLEACKET